MDKEKLNSIEKDIVINNKFKDEYFKLAKSLNELMFEENIYVSNYGEVYNADQDKLFEYENSTLNLKVYNSGFKGISRWDLTVFTFNISNSEYEKRRKLKKVSYGLNIQNQKNTKNKHFKNTSKNIVDNTKIFQLNNNNNNTFDFMLNDKDLDLDIKNLELELIKYNFIYQEICKQKEHLKTHINKLEMKLKDKKAMNDSKYKNTVIYMIRPKHNNFHMYIGHTIDKERRLKEHINATNTDNNKLYKTIRETGGWEHWEMIEISLYECTCREEALKIEQEWCEKLRPNLNSKSPFV